MRSPFISAIVAGSLLVSATSAAARQPGLPVDRSAAEVENADGIRGTLMIVGLIVVLLIIGGVILLDGDDEPESP